MPALTNPAICFLSYETWDNERLELLARAALPPGTDPPSRKSLQRHRSFLAGRAAVAAILAARSPGCWVLPDPFLGFLRVQNARGFLENAYVNLSHTRSVAVAVWSDTPIGIDVEAVDRDTSRVMRRVLHPTEKKLLTRQQLAVGDRQVPISVAFWSGKEAYSKAVGLGIKFGLHRFKLDLSGSSPHAAATDLQGPHEISDAIVTFRCHGDYLVSLCGERASLGRGIQEILCS